jgi:hydrogenase expression/formation protein HypE
MTSKARISLAHGNGGRLMRELIEDVFAKHLSDPEDARSLDVTVDAAAISLENGIPFLTTDGFIVQPLEFPGGNIGSLAVHGTVNDLAVSGARPRFLTLNAFIEEGLELAVLDRIIASLAEAAREAGVRVVAGDTKVLPRGEGGGLYLATAGVGVRDPSCQLGPALIQPGDRVLVSGPIGDHGVSIMLARQEFAISGNVVSDSASVLRLTRVALQFDGLRFMRDPTRGGLAGVACEIARQTGLAVHLDESSVPVRDPVAMVCEMLGYDPYCLACEGRVVAVISAAQAGQLAEVWRGLSEGAQATEIGRVETGEARVVLHTTLGGERMLEELEEDPLPRIC